MKRSIAGLVLGLATVTASAAQPGYYLGGGLGAWQIDESGFDDTALALRVQGGYRFNDYLSVDGTLLYGDELEDSGLKIDGTGFELALRPSVPIGDAFEAYARLGYGWYDFDAGGAFNASGSEDEFVWGLGGAWQANNRWSFSVEYTEPDFEAETRFLWFGATYRLGL
ncbi:MAG TPA: outer membrane beta-barrel protein [Pseudomonadales bacterium]|nr:outer membrane beta-barrel protein [Pseudomonadales bacterium]